MKEAIVVAVESVAAAGGGVLEPYNVVPIPGSRLASYPHPFQQTP